MFFRPILAAVRDAAGDFNRRAVKSVFSFSELNAVTPRMQVGANPSRFEDFSLPFSLISVVDRIAFGSYRRISIRTGSTTRVSRWAPSTARC